MRQDTREAVRAGFNSIFFIMGQKIGQGEKFLRKVAGGAAITAGTVIAVGFGAVISPINKGRSLQSAAATFGPKIISDIWKWTNGE